MSDTFCTVIIPASEQAAAHETYPVYFVVGLSATGEEPATHYVSSGAFANSEMTEMVTHIPQGWAFDFGNDLPGALAAAGLQTLSVVDEAQP